MRTLLAAAALLLTASVAHAAKPNFVVVMTDDMSVPMLQAMPLTRQLIGDAGLSFEQAFVEVPLCCPSRATFISGRYAHNHGVLHNGRGGGFTAFKGSIGERDSIAVALKAGGYRTGLFGKYLNNYLPKDAAYIPPGWTRWFASTGNFNGGFNWQVSDQGVSRTITGYSTDVLIAETAKFIRGAGSAPFFALVTVSAPHEPSIPAARHAGLLAGSMVPRTPAFNEEDVSDKPAFLQFPALDPAAIAHMDERWSDSLRSLLAVDEGIRTLYETLRDTGKLANTYLIFTSDHGYHMGEHRLPEGKQAPYDVDLRIPLLVRGPGIAAGRIDTTNMVLNVDLAPTIIQTAGVTIPAGMDGRSFRPLLRGLTPATPWRTAFPIGRWRASNDNLSPWPNFRGVRTSTAKYVEWPDGSRELYDILADPFELNNIADTAETATLQAALAARTAALASCVGAQCRQLER